jgi:hypothetical protein
MDLMELFNQAWGLIAGFNQLDLAGKIGGIVLLVLSIVKNSALRPLWDKAGAWKVVVAPALAVLYALIMVQPFTLKAVVASLVGGALAVASHELLDAIKNLPGIGPAFVKAIGFVQGILKAPKAA